MAVSMVVCGSEGVCMVVPWALPRRGTRQKRQLTATDASWRRMRGHARHTRPHPTRTAPALATRTCNTHARLRTHMHAYVDECSAHHGAPALARTWCMLPPTHSMPSVPHSHAFAVETHGQPWTARLCRKRMRPSTLPQGQGMWTRSGAWWGGAST